MNNELNNINECITDIKSIISSSCLNVVCDDILKEVKEPIDVDKFKTWFNYNLNKFKDKSNQNQYFKKAFINELNKGTFVLNTVNYEPATQPLINELRSKGIIILADDTAYLRVLWKELLGTYQIPANTAIQINRYAINNLQITSDFKHYKELIKKAPMLSNYKIDWADIDHKTKVYIASWNFYLAAVEESYD